MDKQNLDDLRHALVQSWNVQLGHEPDGDALLDSLTHRVAFLMKHDYEGLLNGLYLLDISEQKFSYAVEMSNNADKARALAELILDREIEKMESRRHYKRQGSVDVPSSEPEQTKFLGNPDPE